MKRFVTFVLLPIGMLCGNQAQTQTHRVAKPQEVVRSVGVYEWTGDQAKPTASRLIPISLAISGSLQDAGVYLARPIPFALLPGNEYLLQSAGVDLASLTLVYARHLQSADSTYEDGWFGYGSYKTLAAGKKQPTLRASRTTPVITGSGDSGRPHLSGQTSSGEQSTTDADSDRPHLTRKDDTAKPDGASDGTESASQTEADRPTMRRNSTGSTPDHTSGPKADSTASADDPDRPTLKRHGANDGKTPNRSGDDLASVSAVGSLNDDPNRPSLHRGKPASAMTEADLPKLTGLPTDLHQMVAVSDAVNRPEHDFTRVWDDAAERTGVLSGMQTLARAKLSTEESVRVVPPPVLKKPVGPESRVRRPRVGLAKAEPLVDDGLKAYLLSYGGLPTFIYTAHTAGQGAALRFVTVVAQRDAMGILKPVLQSVTDATHLDRTPRMKFVDVVDADASNRASLLFELRAQNSRQFALYRVIGAAAEQTLLTGSTQ